MEAELIERSLHQEFDCQAENFLTEEEKYFLYEERKRWLQKKNLTPLEYESAIREIVDELGI